MYTLSANQTHLTAATTQHLEQRLDNLLHRIPKRFADSPIHISLKENLSHGVVAGSMTWRLPQKTLAVHRQGTNFNQVINELTTALTRQLDTYRAKHDKSHSDHPAVEPLKKIV